jgi:hypothetical protein
LTHTPSTVPDARLDRLGKHARTAATVVAVAVILTATWWMVSPMRSAGFGVIDDHEIAAMLDGRDRLRLSEYPNEVIDRAVEPVGRFRPVYWLGRVGETTIIGDRPSRWYVDRILLAAGSALLLFTLLRRWMHPLFAVLPSMALVTGPYTETWARLGPSEAYAVPLVLAGIVVLVRRLTSEGPSNRWFHLALVLLPAAALAKENFLLLTAPLILVAILLPGIRRDASRAAVLAGLLLTVAAAAGIVWQVRRFGDVYQTSRTPGGTVDRFVAITRAFDDVHAWMLVVAVSLAALVLCRRMRPVRDLLLLVLGGLGLLVLPQAWFYSGDALAPRYYYPAAFFVPLVLAGSLALLWARRRSWPAFAALLLVAAVAGSHVWREAEKVREHSVSLAQFTAGFGASLTEVETLGREVDAVVISTAEPLRYYEALISTGIFVRTRLGHRHPPVMLGLSGLPRAGDAFADSLTRRLDELSTQGGEGFAAFSPTPNCLAVLIGGGAPNPCGRAVTMHGIP